MTEAEDNTGFALSVGDLIVGKIFFPASSEDLGVFYLIWISLFLAVNIGWDAFSKQTPSFHLKRLEQKPTVLFSAATFASSLIIISSLVSAPVRSLLADNSLPIVLAGFAGVLMSIPSICPYEIPNEKPK